MISKLTNIQSYIFTFSPQPMSCPLNTGSYMNILAATKFVLVQVQGDFFRKRKKRGAAAAVVDAHSVVYSRGGRGGGGE